MSFKVTFKQKFIAGLFVVLPVMVTIYLLYWLFQLVDGFLGPVYERIFHQHISGLGFLTTIILIFLAGVFATNVLGKKLIKYFEKTLLTIPILKSIYSPIKSIMDAFSSSSSFKEFVIVEYPRTGVYAFGFLTSEYTLKQRIDGSTEALSTVYIPTNNLYLGEIALFKPKDIFYTNIPVEDGIKIVLSGGIATPKHLQEEKK